MRLNCAFITGSSEISSNEESGTDLDSDAPLVNLVSADPPANQNINTDLVDGGAQNILSLLSSQSSTNKGPIIHTDVSDLLSGFLLKGIDKESRTAVLDSYPCIANCSALQPPAVNQEIKSCLDANALKQDNFLMKLQSQLAAGISILAMELNGQYQITKEKATEETKRELEKKCDPVKIFSDVFHALSLHRRHGIIPFLDSGVRTVLDSCPIDDFLFGKSFPEQLKSSNEAQRLGSSIKKKDKGPKYVPSKALATRKAISEPRAGPSGLQSLNFRRTQPRSRMKKEEGRYRSRGAYTRRQ